MTNDWTSDHRSVTMQKLVSFILVVLIVMTAAIPASAAEGEKGWGWWIEGAGRFVNLFILFGIIIYFVREPLKKFFAERRTGIQREIREAREAGEEAEKKLASLENRMKNLDQELATIRREADREVALERRRILEEAERDAVKIAATARREIEGLTRAAEKQLKAYASQLAVELAEEQIRRDISEQDERRVIDRFFVKLGAAGRGDRK